MFKLSNRNRGAKEFTVKRGSQWSLINHPVTFCTINNSPITKNKLRSMFHSLFWRFFQGKKLRQSIFLSKEWHRQILMPKSLNIFLDKTVLEARKIKQKSVLSLLCLDLLKFYFFSLSKVLWSLHCFSVF